MELENVAGLTTDVRIHQPRSERSNNQTTSSPPDNNGRPSVNNDRPSANNTLPPVITTRPSVKSQELSQRAVVVWYCSGLLFVVASLHISLFGLFSPRWIQLSVRHDSDVPDDVVAESTLHFGVWKACLETGVCGKPWEIVPGLVEIKLKRTQLIVGVATSAFLLSLVAMVIQTAVRIVAVARPRKANNCCVRGMVRIPLVEVLSCTACLATILTMLVMGRLKSSVISHKGHTLAVGSGFLLTLVGILLLVAGIFLMLFIRHRLVRIIESRYLNTAISVSWKRFDNPDVGTETDGGGVTVSNDSPKTSNPHDTSIAMIDIIGGDDIYSMLEHQPQPGASKTMTCKETHSTRDSNPKPSGCYTNSGFSDESKHLHSPSDDSIKGERSDVSGSDGTGHVLFPEDDYLLANTSPRNSNGVRGRSEIRVNTNHISPEIPDVAKFVHT